MKGEMNRPERERKNMKTILTLTVVGLISLAASAEVATKGGASGLMKAPPTKTGAQVTEMKCALCKSEFVNVKVLSFKGSPSSVLVERHGCVLCSNEWVTTGHGKAKTEVAVHTCCK